MNDNAEMYYIKSMTVDEADRNLAEDDSAAMENEINAIYAAAGSLLRREIIDAETHSKLTISLYEVMSDEIESVWNKLQARTGKYKAFPLPLAERKRRAERKAAATPLQKFREILQNPQTYQDKGEAI